MKTFYQNIFNRQEVKEGMEAIDEFLKLDDDNSPYQELLNRRISGESRNSMEGIIILQEMTRAFNEDMKGTSTPGVYEFTVNFIQQFWDSSVILVVNAVNKCKSKNKSTSTLRTAILSY